MTMFYNKNKENDELIESNLLYSLSLFTSFNIFWISAIHKIN
jgi:hypothetical protein